MEYSQDSSPSSCDYAQMQKPGNLWRSSASESSRRSSRQITVEELDRETASAEEEVRLMFPDTQSDDMSTCEQAVQSVELHSSDGASWEVCHFRSMYPTAPISNMVRKSQQGEFLKPRSGPSSVASS